jgi:CHAT domain-containing protein
MTHHLPLFIALWGTFFEASGADAPERLVPGESRQRIFVPPGASHQHALAVAPDAYVLVSVTPRDSDVVVTLRGPDGKPLAEVDDDWTEGREELEWVGGAEGALRIEVRSKRPAVPGSYEISVSEPRAATGPDRVRVAAARAIWRGNRLFDEQKAESTKAAAGAFEEAAALSRSSGDVRGEARALGWLASVQTSLTDWAAAIEHSEAALALWQRLGNRRHEASMLGSASNAFQKLGKREEALELAQEALALATQEKDREGEMRALMLFALVKPPAQARADCELALSIARALGDRRSEAEALSDLVTIHADAGDLEAALETLHRALIVSREMGARTLETINLHNLGNVYLNLGEPQRARVYLEQAVVLCRELGNRAGEAIVLNNLGLSYRLEQEYPRGAQLIQESLPLRREIGDRAGEARSLSTLAFMQMKMGNTQEAWNDYERALAIPEVDATTRGAVILGMSMLARDAGDLDGSRALSLSALAASPDEGTAFGVFYQLAKVEKARGDLEEADALVQLAMEVLDSRQQRMQSADFRASVLALTRDAFDFQVAVLMALHAADPGAGHDVRAFQAVERTRARGLLDLLAQSRGNVREGVEAELLEQERSVRERLSKASAGTLRARAQGAQAVEAVEREMEALTRELQRVEAEIRKRSPRYASLTQPEPITVAGLQALLDDDTLLLEYSLGKDGSYAWLIGPRSMTSVALPPREEIEAAARRALAAIESEQADAEAAAKDLSRLVLGPLADRLTSRRLVVVADGALLYVPFAALPHPTAGEPLLVRQEVVSLPSASTLALLRRDRPARVATTGTVAVLADPVFDAGDERLLAVRQGRPPSEAVSPSTGVRINRAAESMGLSGPIPRLPFTRREAQAIVASTPARSSLAALDFDASRATILDPRLAQYRVVHLATHGFFNASRPELSGILLSMFDKQGQPQPGFLTAADTFNLRLAADLVVLSGCRTALGREVKGEGIVGLTRGFMYAGADRVLASLWPVDDAATAALMARFYSGMFGPRPLPPAAALRAAQLDLMKQPRYRHPFFWAAFQIQGEWR